MRRSLALAWFWLTGLSTACAGTPLASRMGRGDYGVGPAACFDLAAELQGDEVVHAAEGQLVKLRQLRFELVRRRAVEMGPPESAVTQCVDAKIQAADDLLELTHDLGTKVQDRLVEGDDQTARLELAKLCIAAVRLEGLARDTCRPDRTTVQVETERMRIPTRPIAGFGERLIGYPPFLPPVYPAVASTTPAAGL